MTNEEKERANRHQGTGHGDRSERGKQKHQSARCAAFTFYSIRHAECVRLLRRPKSMSVMAMLQQLGCG